MEKRKRKGTSIAWFLFFNALGCLLPNQWKVIMFSLAGLVIAWSVTSRIRIRLLSLTWLIFPVLCFTFMDSVGNRAVGWCEKNSPSVLAGNAVRYIKKEIKDGKTPEKIQDLIDESPEAKQKLITDVKGELKSGFSKSISTIKNIAKHLFKKLFSKTKPLMTNS